MKHIFFAMFMVLSFSSSLYSQTSKVLKLDVDHGVINDNSRKILAEISGSYGENIYGVRVKEKDFNFSEDIQLVKYNEKMEAVETIDIELGDFSKKDIGFFKSRVQGDRLFIFTYSYHKRSPVVQIQRLAIDLNNFTSGKELKNITTVAIPKGFRKGTGSLVRTYLKETLRFVELENGSKYAIFAKQSSDETDLKYNVKIYSSEGEENSIDITADFESSRANLENILISKRGEIFAIVRLWDLEKNYFNGIKQCYNFSIVGWDKDGEEKFTKNIEPKEGFLSRLNIQLENDDILICAGSYTLQKKVTAKGYVFSSIETKTGEGEIRTVEFPSDMINTVNKRDYILTKNKELAWARLQEIAIDSKGNTILVFVENRSEISGSSATNISEKIVLVSINKKGKLNWWTEHNRNVRSSKYPSLRIHTKFFNDGECSYLIYNTGLSSAYRKAEKIDADGNVYTSKNNWIKGDLVMMPSISYLLDDRTIVILQTKQKKERLVKVKFM